MNLYFKVFLQSTPAADHKNNGSKMMYIQEFASQGGTRRVHDGGVPRIFLG